MGKPEPIRTQGFHRYQHSKFPAGTRVHIAEYITGIYPETKEIADKTVQACFGFCDTYNGRCSHSHDYFVPVHDDETGKTYYVEHMFVQFAEEEHNDE